MCQHGDRTMTEVHVHWSIAHEETEVYKPMPIDTCIAPLVKALDDLGIRMLGSCCGHGEMYGQISLVAGGVIIIEQHETHVSLRVDPAPWVVPARTVVQ